MLFQFSRFWQNYGFTSALDTVLEKADCTLERILDEENILPELKNSGATKFAKLYLMIERPQASLQSPVATRG